MRARKSKRGKSADQWFNDLFGRTIDFKDRTQPKGDIGAMLRAGGKHPDLSAPEYQGPMIVGYTHTAWGNPIPGGLEKWQRMTPEERFWASDLGKALEFSTQYDPNERRDPAAYARKLAKKGDYWGGLARNIMTGSALPEARIQKGAIMGGDPRDPAGTHSGSGSWTQQTQTIEGITRSAFQDKKAQQLAADAEKSEESNLAFGLYMQKKYGVQTDQDLQFVWDRLRGNV